jgi:hypothetical protein
LPLARAPQRHSRAVIETIFPPEVVGATWYVGLRNGLDLTFGIFLIAGMARRAAVRGTRPRLTWATIQRTACLPSLLFLVLTTARSIGLTQWAGLVLIPAAMAAWAYTYQQMRADSDDDAYRRLGRRLARRAHTKTRHASTAPGPA